MTPTNIFISNRWVYDFRAPRRGEIVVLRDPTDGAYCVKRVIALPGEAVAIKNGRLLVNGKELPEPYLPYGVKTFTPEAVQDVKIDCGKNSYFRSSATTGITATTAVSMAPSPARTSSAW